MTQTFMRTFVAIVLLLAFFSSSASACGPFSMEAIFVFSVHPAYPLDRFARGELGVIQPSYARSYLYVAYRYLQDSPFSQEEQKALTELWNDRLNNSFDWGEQDWIKTWLDARQKVVGSPDSPKIEIYRNREKPNEYETYVNCTKDAFETAVKTLNERIKKYGPDNGSIHTWIEAQDQVFANCFEGQHIPATLPPNADALARADRTYQIAAANFYSTNFDEARKGFEAIAADDSSPWQPTAPYLVARTLVRKASLGAGETRKDSLTQAENQLRKILTDKKFAGVHAASSRLLDLVRFRLRPSERMHELAHTLLSKSANPHLKQDLWDYTTLLDGVLEADNAANASSSIEDLRSDDLSDWLSTFQGNSHNSAEHALARWQTTHSPAWLVAVLTRIKGNDGKSPDLIRDALNVKSNSAAFASARVHAVRLLIESGKTDQARSVLDQILKNNRAQFDPSSLNLLLAERMMLATGLSEFLSYVPKVPAALSWNDDGREIPTESSEISDDKKPIVGKPLFDGDSAKALNQQVPLVLLKEAAISQSLPTHLRIDLAQAAWIRSALLSDYKTADELVPTLKALVPELSLALDDFLQTTQPDAKKFSAVYTWLKFPGIEPVVDTGIGRGTPLNEQDSYRDNWWCAASITPSAEPATEENDVTASFTNSATHVPLFLTDAQRLAATKEWTTLSSLGAIPNYLCKQVIQWATKNPADSRAPEALHLAVNSTRYGCTDKETGRWSKAAFDLLHGKYPNSTWAKKTKYWFKE